MNVSLDLAMISTLWNLGELLWNVSNDDNAASAPASAQAANTTFHSLTAGGVAVNASANIGAPLQVAGATMSLLGTEPNGFGMAATELLAGTHLVGVVVSRPLSTAPNATDTLTAARATLASPLVSVRLIGADGDGESLIGAEVLVAIPVAPLPIGTGACKAAGSWPWQLPSSGQTCVAGCCSDEACACRPGYLGRHCEFELRCALVSEADGLFDISGGTCATVGLPDEQGHLTCRCSQLGTIAALRFKLMPPTNAMGGFGELHRSMGRTAPLLSVPPQSWLLPLLLSGFGAALVMCWWGDLSTLYLSPDSPRLLWCLRPHDVASHLGPHTSVISLHLQALRLLVVATVLTRSSVLRVYHAYPGVTIYTHTQLLVVLANSIVINALCVALFFQRDTEVCSAIASLVAFLSLATASLLASAGRLVFRWANLVKGSTTRARYAAHKRARNDALSRALGSAARRLAAPRGPAVTSSPGGRARVSEYNSDDEIGVALDGALAAPFPPPESSPKGRTWVATARQGLCHSPRPTHKTAPREWLTQLTTVSTAVCSSARRTDKSDDSLQLTSPPPSPPPNPPPNPPPTDSSPIQPTLAVERREAAQAKAQAKLLRSAHDSAVPAHDAAVVIEALSRRRAAAGGRVKGVAHDNAYADGPTLLVPSSSLARQEGGMESVPAYRTMSGDRAPSGKRAHSGRSHGARRNSVRGHGGQRSFEGGSSGSISSLPPPAALGLCLRTRSGEIGGCFVAATHIGLRVCRCGSDGGGGSGGGGGGGDGPGGVSGGGGWLRVTLERCPPGVSHLSTGQVVPPPAGEAPRLPLCRCGWRTLLAWAFNLLLLVGASVLLVHVLLSLQLLPEQLEAQSVSRAEWERAYHGAVALSLLMSFVVVDGVKVSVLTMLSLPAIEEVLRGRLRSRFIRKPLRRIYKVLDVML